MGKFFFRSVTLVMLSLFVISCGKAPSNVLSGVKVSSSIQDEDIWMSFAATLNLGAMNFASISVPIPHPHGQTPIGQLDLVSGLGGSNQIQVKVNVSELTGVNTSTSLLPNGNLIPLIANNPTIVVNIGNGARLYLTISEKVTAIGVAVPIAAFDSIGSALPGLNFFPVVNVDKVIGTAGVFTGAKAGQSGIAVVADVSQIVKLGSILPDEPTMFSARQAEVSREAVRLDYKSQAGSSSQKSRLDNMLYELNKKKTTLRMRR